MDPITHGITGALLGKGYFAERKGRIAIFAATLGALFPDVDIIAEIVSRDPLAIVKYHRGITHSFVGLPFFAALLAWLTRWVARRRGIDTPSWATLTLIYGIGIASHIVLDGMTSFGTRMWTPISQQRVSWDLLFIIDFSFTAIILLPQIAAWIYSDQREKPSARHWMWVLFTLAAVVGLDRSGMPRDFRFICGLLALVERTHRRVVFSSRGGRLGISRYAFFLVPGRNVRNDRLSFRLRLAHHAAMRRVKDFASANKIQIGRMGALPLPPSFLDWGGVIRTVNGVYQARFDLRNPAPPDFHFAADSPPDPFIARALQVPEVQLFWQFARFPVIHSSTEGAEHIVDIGENRFVNTRRNKPQPFTYRLIFDDSGDLLEQGWQSDGMFLRHMQKLSPQRNGETP